MPTEFTDDMKVLHQHRSSKTIIENKKSPPEKKQDKGTYKYAVQT
jgi:hypothetical protein